MASTKQPTNNSNEPKINQPANNIQLTNIINHQKQTTIPNQQQIATTKQPTDNSINPKPNWPDKKHSTTQTCWTASTINEQQYPIKNE